MSANWPVSRFGIYLVSTLMDHKPSRFLTVRQMFEAWTALPLVTGPSAIAKARRANWRPFHTPSAYALAVSAGQKMVLVCQCYGERRFVFRHRLARYDKVGAAKSNAEASGHRVIGVRVRNPYDLFRDIFG
jgi:hypothetical protein